MGKLHTGCNLLGPGKVRSQTCKVERQEKRKKHSGRSGRRKRLGRKLRVEEQHTTPNSSLPLSGLTPRDDPYTQFEDKTLATTCRVDYDRITEHKIFKSHHQEAGKQWARQTKLERQAKMEERTTALLDEESGTSEEAWTSEEEESEDAREGKQQVQDESAQNPAELTDLAFINFGNQVSYNPDNLGFTVIENFIDGAEVSWLLQHIEANEWKNDHQNRRVQIFGYNFLAPQHEHKPIPYYFAPLRAKLEAAGFGTFEELLVAEYAPGVGIDPHVDRFFWGGRVVGVSLISPCKLVLQDIRNNNEEHQTDLVPGSLYCLEGRSRYDFSHSIPAESVTGRRISLTFRNLAKEKVVVRPDTKTLIELN